MFSHVNLGSNDLERSKKFYDAVMGVLGIGPAISVNFNSPRIFYSHGDTLLTIAIPLNGKPAHGANGGTIGFRIDSREKVDAWHAASMANGGTTCEDPPGVRDTPVGQLYLAYMRDPDGNKLCGFHSL
ncbi:VOC family protein [Burkholderia cenocepacia]|uniref:VOC family protein n=1 Tax=Burkholderia cenocepacia TaxID=95486 RepID=UPI000756EF51|nr:VOC family protein [Burkholderia cenocepacia]AOK36209.1 glyoxalase [Burkholderia cenocepacia]KWF64088.1 glyoxalase [Burkholderia cenocepacia]